MRARLLVFLTLLGAASTLVSWRLVDPLALPRGAAALAHLGVAAAFAVMLLVPVGWMGRGALGAFARLGPVRGTAYMSMAFLSVLIAVLVARDLAVALAHLLELAGVALDPHHLEQLGSLAAVPLAVALTTWGWLSVRRGAKTVHVRVPIAGLPDAFAGFRIVQLSDVHIGETVRRPNIERLVAEVNALGADLVAITGDLVDGPVAHLAAHAAPLAGLRSRHGTHFCAGNHDHYSGLQAWAAHLEGVLGMTVLIDAHREIVVGEHTLTVAGVNDLSASDDPEDDVRRAFHGATPSSVRVLLAHHPRSARAAHVERIDLQLSGHTHGGQFLPWNLVAPLIHGFTAGLQKVGAMWLYVSRGTFYWGPPVRLFAPAEITVLELQRA